MNVLAAINSYQASGLPQVMKTPALTAGAPKISGSDVLELSSIASGQGTQPTAASTGAFSDVLSQMVREVDTKQHVAGDSVNALLSGQNVPLHQTMVAMEEASISFQLMVEVRNKLLESYQELMRMQV